LSRSTWWLALVALWSLVHPRVHAQNPTQVSPTQLAPADLFAAADPRSSDFESERMAELSGAAKDGAALRAKRLAGVAIDRLESYDGEFDTETQKVPLHDLHLLDLQIVYDVRPPFVEREPYTPVLDYQAREDSPQVRGIKNLAQKEFFRQLRKHLKRQWRSTFKHQTDMRYDEYESTVIAINGLGRDLGSEQSAGDYYSREARGSVFRRGAEQDDEVPVIQLGPLVLFDSGSLNIDLRSVRDMVSGGGKEGDRSTLAVAPEMERVRQPLFSGKNYRFNTRFRVDVNPFRCFRSGEVLDIAKSVGVVAEVTWLTDILRRDIFSTQIEAQYTRDDGLGFFFNVVMNSR